MVETVSVSVSGLAFSLLLYENIKSSYDQEGFLLGDIITTESSKLTDADQEVVNIEKIIHINSVMPCPQQCYFYNQAGKIDNHRLKEFLGEKIDKVVAWYKYKKITSFKLTLREKIVHKQLANIFNTDLFSMCILLTDTSDNFATHTFHQTFIRYCAGYQPIPLHITNLSQNNNCYKVSEPLPPSFAKVMKAAKVDLNNSQGLVVANKIQAALQNYIDKLVLNIHESEKELYELEEEVKQLRQNLKWKRELNCDLGNGLDSNIFNGMEESPPILANIASEEACQATTASSEKKLRRKSTKKNESGNVQDRTEKIVTRGQNRTKNN